MRIPGGHTVAAIEVAAIGVAAIGLLGIAACGGSGTTGLTAPTPGANPTPRPSAAEQLRAFELSCPAALIIGQRAPCIAVAFYDSGRQPVVSVQSAWTSSRSDVVAVESFGAITGKSGGEAVVTASYQERQASATVVVSDVDALRIDSGQGQQGPFTPGSTVTMWLQGYYSVSSAETGRLSLRITDQTGIITSTAPLTVAKGGNFFLLSSTFVIPDDSVEVCRTAILEVGAVTIAEPQSKAYPLWCLPVRR